jgi:hypothetical protein
MFRIRVFAPSLTYAHDSLNAVGELVIGDARQHFRLDLRAWSIADYERQWKAGVSRLVYGAPSSALMSAYRGDHDAPHLMWALWREAGFVYVQPQCVLNRELSSAFDPCAPYEHVGARVPATEQSLPIVEWRVELAQLYTNAFNVRWPPPFGQ